jgi:hypothetical protein
MKKNMDEDNISAPKWLSENYGIILSILMVIMLAVGIYSYSKRTHVDNTPKCPVASELIN